MSKTLIMYYSKYGFTKKYAAWLAEDLAADVFPIRKIRKKMLGNYDTIILGSSIYAGKIKGTDILVKNFENIKNKRLLIFTCGIADTENEQGMTEINNKIGSLIPENVRAALTIFNLQGGINFQMLSWRHKMIMKILNLALSHKATSDLTEDNIKFLNSYGKNRDYTSRDNISDLVDYCRGVADND